ncbi:MAG: DUF4278 domain-containing protein [Aphanocapsa feldmannii 277cV]|uniref:DUF4278 domain-containing protein n=2 Tax=Aphanocapsa feldmannii TaxID=192050 RepID=A0A524RLR2_9CHRO|nr:MAG: DUF4278 domain-containing protein [Aphanocapsa feldmannii 288cV]TGG91007.1 MAG: DUF4278 domain-containing protein [Aphanocapsa feldmannii 277cV]TGH21933.1 MAG: DUF4278 domain-containing protein [Aphanocapsa feldmannii 277cI]
MVSLTYRGVTYDTTAHEAISTVPVDHVYRGVHYNEALHHDVPRAAQTVKLTYRGKVYQARCAAL